MCTVLLPPGVNPIAVNKYIISYSLFWDVTQRSLVVTDVSGQAVGPILYHIPPVSNTSLQNT